MMRKIFLATCLLAAGMQLALGQILLTVNVADPSNVTVTGSGLNPSMSVASSTYAFPIRLDSFFTGTPTADPNPVTASSSSLLSTVSGHTISVAIFNRSLPGFTSLSLRSAGVVSESFSTDTPAFTGVATFDFSHIADFLPLDGASGSIKTSDGTSIIGTFSVVSSVPEPATYGVIAGVACLGFGVWRKRKAQATA